MSLDINISVDFAEALEIFEKQMGRKEVYRAASSAANKTLLTIRKEGVNLLQQTINIKSNVLRDKYISLTKSRVSQGTIDASVNFSGRPLPLLEFVRGNKNISTDDQKGVPVKRRKKLKLQITPGKTFVLRKAFIQKVGSKQVFKRKPGGKGFKAQKAPSVGATVLSRKHQIGLALVDIGRRRFERLLIQELDARFNKRFVTGPRTP